MSIFNRAWEGLFGPSQATVQDFAVDLDRWIAVNRRWKANLDRFNQLTGQMEAWGKDKPDDHPVMVKWYRIQESLSVQADQIRAHNATILGWAQKAIEAGHVRAATVAEYRRRLTDASGLGELLTFTAAIAIGIILVMGAGAIATVKLALAWAERELLLTTQEVSMMERTFQADMALAAKEGRAPVIPTRPDVKASPIESAISGSVRGVGIAAALVVVVAGGAFAYNASKKGGRR